MNKHIGFILIGLIIVEGCSNYSPAHANSPQDTDKMSWLSGCWHNQDGTMREVWSEGFDGLLFGYSVTQKQGKVTFFEALRIERREADHVYIAAPNGTGITEFVLTDTGEHAAVFENPAHDFPQRLHYQRNGDQLTIDVSTLDLSRGFQVNLSKCD